MLGLGLEIRGRGKRFGVADGKLGLFCSVLFDFYIDGLKEITLMGLIELIELTNDND